MGGGSILDFNKNIRGTLGGWGYGIEKLTMLDDAKEMIEALESGEAFISKRNFVDLQIKKTEKL